MFDKKKSNLGPAKDNPPSDKLFNSAFLVLLSLAVTSLMVLYIDRLPSNIFEGGIATQDIRADQNYEIPDLEATEKLQASAAEKALPVYTYDVNQSPRSLEKISKTFENARESLQKQKVFLEKQKPSGAEVEKSKIEEQKSNFEIELKKKFLKEAAVAVSDELYDRLRKDEFSLDVQKVAEVFLESVQKKLIIFDKSEIIRRGELGIAVRLLNQSSNEYEDKIINSYESILNLSEARNLFDKVPLSDLRKSFSLKKVDSDQVKLGLNLFSILVKVNLTIDKVETEKRRERALSNVQSIIYKLQKGQIIIRRGDRYESRHVTILNGIRQSRLETNLILKFFGVFLLVLFTLFIIMFYAKRTLKTFKPNRKDLNFLGFNLILFLAILRLGSFIGSSLQDSLPFTVGVSTFYYAIPIAAGTMIVRFILAPVVSFVFAVILSLFAGLFLEQNFQIMTYYLLSSVSAAYLIGGVERRSSVLRQGLKLGFIQMGLVLSLDIINTVAHTSALDVQTVLLNGAFAFFGGALCSLILLALSPLIEAVFNYTTNIQLLELANMNHPLLREMIVRAPGTYLHSQLVGTLSEAATRAIKGNSLLARVGSYYHDIGKMKKPQYFIENQKGTNPHDTLAPSMSALIIDAHVKDGLEMAREYKLPQIITDFIPEHQGTKLIGYFYHKARKEAGEEADKIDERDYRYSGPRPQTRESGVVMLADTIEAAVRSMTDKSPQKIKAQVEKLVNYHFVDGQLDECDLTLRDLHIIVDAFVKILIGIYHQRVEYPDDAKKSAHDAPEIDSPAADSYRQSTSQPNNIAPLFKEKRRENL